MELTERQLKLMEFIKNLDMTKRHVLKVACRGNEPWQIEEISTISKIDLKPLNERKKDSATRKKLTYSYS